MPGALWEGGRGRGRGSFCVSTHKKNIKKGGREGGGGGPLGAWGTFGGRWRAFGGPGGRLRAWGTFGDRVKAFGTPVVFWELDVPLGGPGWAFEGLGAGWEPWEPLGTGGSFWIGVWGLEPFGSG